MEAAMGTETTGKAAWVASRKHLFLVKIALLEHTMTSIV